MGAQVIDSSMFENEVIKGAKAAVVDFGATWCGPCQALAPAIDKLAQKYEGRVIIGKVDVDKEQELAARFNVMSVPTILFFKDGKKVDQVTGNLPDQIEKKIEGLLAPA
jgi:thioredoxin 1